MSITTLKKTPPSQSPNSKAPAETAADEKMQFPVETDIIIHANGDVTIADLPQELEELQSQLSGCAESED